MYMKVSDDIKFESRAELPMLQKLREIICVFYIAAGNFVHEKL